MALRVQLDHHVAVAVHGPDIVVGIDAHLLGGQEAIDLLADLADEFSVRAELIKAGAAMREGAAATQDA